MKTLTLTQPWASLVALEAKHIETRSWRTDYRGPIAIHAAKEPSTFGWMQLQHLCRNVEPFRSTLAHLIQDRHVADALPLGAVIATAELVHCMPTTWLTATGRTTVHTAQGPREYVLTDHERAFGDYNPLRYAWLLMDVQLLPKPIPAKGALGLWDWTPPEGWQP